MEKMTWRGWGSAAATLVVMSAHAGGDFNGNGKDDLVMYDPITTSWYIQEVDGAVLASGVEWGDVDAIPLVGDFNGDGIADLAVYHPASGSWDIRTLAGAVLAQGLAWGAPGAIPLVGDFNGDDADDLVYYLPQTGAWHIRTLGGAVLANGVSLGIANATPVPGDYTGNGSFDLAVYVEATGRWYIRTLGGANIVWNQAWGFGGTIPVAGDFDGNGIYDMAVYETATGKWHIRHVAGNVMIMNLTAGPANAIPQAGDFSGNGAHDLAVFGPKPAKTWGIRSIPGNFVRSGVMVAGAPASAIPVGPMYRPGEINYAQYKPVNDFNGDGKSDLAVYHPATGQWFIRTVDGAVLEWARSWGYAGTVPVPADYNGDGHTDLGIYDPSNGKWFIVTRNHQYLAFGVAWGYPGAIPVPGDYDGDGKADLAVYDPNTGHWFVRKVTGGTIFWAQPWGWRGDVRGWERPRNSTVIPVPYDYDRDGKVDLAVYYRGFSMNDSGWYIRGSAGRNWMPVTWGSSGSIPVPGMYRSIVDANLYPPGVTTYKIKYSPPNDGTDGTFNTPYTHQFKVGTYGRTLPVAAQDVNGSGYDDHIVYDYLNGNWIITLNNGSGNGDGIVGSNAYVPQPKVTIAWGFNGAIPANLYSTIISSCGYTLRPW